MVSPPAIRVPWAPRFYAPVSPDWPPHQPPLLWRLSGPAITRHCPLPGLNGKSLTDRNLLCWSDPVTPLRDLLSSPAPPSSLCPSLLCGLPSLAQDSLARATPICRPWACFTCFDRGTVTSARLFYFLAVTLLVPLFTLYVFHIACVSFSTH